MWMSRVISSPPTTTCSFGCALRPAPSVARRNARVRCTHLAIGRAPVPPPTPREHSAGECADGRGAVCRSRERLECRAEAGRRVLSTTRRCRAFGPAGRCSPHPSVRAHPQPARSVVQSHAPWRSVKCISLVCCLSDQSAHFTFSQHPPTTTLSWHQDVFIASLNSHPYTTKRHKGVCGGGGARPPVVILILQHLESILAIIMQHLESTLHQ